MQATELFDDEEQDQDPGKARDEEILPVLPQTYRA